MNTTKNAVNESALTTLDEGTLTFEELEARLELQAVFNPMAGDTHYHFIG